MNRQERRAHVRRLGGDWRREQAAKRHADEMDRTALQMSPQQARILLGMWASAPGRTQAEVDAMNGKGPECL